MQTDAPLVPLLRETSQVTYVTTHFEDEREALITDVLTRSGVVLVAWEHRTLPSLIGFLPDAPAVPATCRTTGSI
jgi:hypothetical protein